MKIEISQKESTLIPLLGLLAGNVGAFLGIFYPIFKKFP